MRRGQRVFIIVNFGSFGLRTWHISHQEPPSEGAQGSAFLSFKVRKVQDYPKESETCVVYD